MTTTTPPHTTGRPVVDAPAAPEVPLAAEVRRSTATRGRADVVIPHARGVIEEGGRDWRLCLRGGLTLDLLHVAGNRALGGGLLRDRSAFVRLQGGETRDQFGALGRVGGSRHRPHPHSFGGTVVPEVE